MALPDSINIETTTLLYLFTNQPTWLLQTADFLNNGTTILPKSGNHSTISEDENNFVYTNFVITFYKIVVPIMIFFCALSIVINIIIVISIRWLRHITPTQYFSISLAVADAYSSLVIGLALLINCVLPINHKIHLQLYYPCSALTLEAFRMAGMISSVLHLLALAINHYIGILRPLHYASTMTRRITKLCIIIMWTVPLLFYFIYFSSMEGRAYQSQYCENYNFIMEFPFRLVTAIIFFTPLFLMAIVYAHIFVLVRKHQNGIAQNQNRNQLKRNVKAIYTTLLILGTYLIGWMPAVIFFLISCRDCRYSFLKLSPITIISISFTTNTLIIIKSLVDPIIYAARMKEIRKALVRMRRACFGQVNVRRISRSRRDDYGSSVRSRTDTTGSIRLQSTYSNRQLTLYQTKELIKENYC